MLVRFNPTSGNNNSVANWFSNKRSVSVSILDQQTEVLYAVSNQKQMFSVNTASGALTLGLFVNSIIRYFFGLILIQR
jgi:hypothetical protein